MSAKNEVIEILDDRIEELNRGMEHFIRFGNKGNVESLQKQTERSIQLVELVSLKSRIEYGVRWRHEKR